MKMKFSIMDNIFGACDKITLFGLWTLLAGRMPSTLWYEQDPHELVVAPRHTFKRISQGLHARPRYLISHGSSLT
jgi:hypothetical protein